MAPRASRATERVLTTRARNRSLLARQLLLQRARLTIPRALDRMGGLQAQYAPSMYVGLWSRIAGFRRSQLTLALERRTVVQATLLRATIHLVSAGDYWPTVDAIGEARRDWWRRATRATDDEVRAVAKAATEVRQAMLHSDDGYLTRAGLDALVGKDRVGSVGMWLDLVRVPPSGTWERRRADHFGLAETWLPRAGAGAGEPDQSAGLRHLARRYLTGFGPASAASFADWAGLTVGAVGPTLEDVAPRRFRDEDGTLLYDLPRAPLPDPDTPAPVRFLPTWDAALLAHARQTGILAEEHRPLIFNSKMPQSIGTFLVDGTVAGTWRPPRKGEARIAVEPFDPLPARVRREVDAEAAGLALLHA